MRLGQRLSGGVAESLEQSHISSHGGVLRLTLQAGQQALYGEIVERRLRTLAGALKRKAEVVIE
jgi:exopolyphosphatase/guanosine-5'-triphosphate,3'-diphosphate pyrophosphatase